MVSDRTHRARPPRWCSRVLGAALLGAAGCGAVSWFLASAERVPENTWLVVDLTSSRGHSGGLLDRALAFGAPPPLDAVALEAALDAARVDPRVQGVLVHSSRPSGGAAFAEDVRDLLGDFRTSGKPVIALLRSADTLGYTAAAGASEVYIDPSSPLGLVGISLSAVFLKEALHQRGVETDLVRVGRYTGLYEQLAATTPSEAFLEATSSLADALFAETVVSIARARGLPEETVRDLIDRSPLAPRAAVEAGLADGVLSAQELDALLAERYGRDVHRLDVRDYPARSSSGRVMHRVALVRIAGVIVDDDLAGALPVRTASAAAAVAAIQAAEDDPGIEGILLRIDSPGGSLAAAERIWYQLQRTRRVKSIVASLGDSGAGAAYYIACGAHDIVAQPGTLTGGIGLLGGKAVLDEFLRARGVELETVKRGRQAGSAHPARPFTIDERRALQEALDGHYRTFVSRAAVARELEYQTVDRAARGRIWTGREALERGLVDELGGISEALAALRRLLELPAEEPLAVLEWPRPRRSALERLGLVRPPEALPRAWAEAPPAGIEAASWAGTSLLRTAREIALMPVWVRFD